MELKKNRVLAVGACFATLIAINMLHFLQPSSGNPPLVAQAGDLAWSQPRNTQCGWWKNDSRVSDHSNGYIIVDCNGGLNQMRRDFCDGVGVARLLNATLLLPQFQGTPYWNDSSGFADIFDADHFIHAMQGYVHVVKELPPPFSSKEPIFIDCQKRKHFDYIETVLPVLLKEKLVIIRPAASQRADRYPEWAKASRCQACFRALRLVQRLETKAKRILDAIPRPFLALHLRFEPDMIAYSRCLYSNLSTESLDAIEAARENKSPFTGAAAVAWRNRGKCPLTPGETAFILQALNIPVTMPVYLASGSGLLELPDFTRVYPNVYRKISILGKETLQRLPSNSRAALDYYVAVESDFYVATYFGNMDKMVVAMRALGIDGGRRSTVLDRRSFAEAVSRGLTGDELSKRVSEAHMQNLVTGGNLPLPDCFCGSSFDDR